MRTARTLGLAALGCAVLLFASQLAVAGVVVGGSTIPGMDALDYSDTFTGTDSGGAADRPYIAAVQPAAAYVIENTYGNPAQSFTNAGFSFAADAEPDRPGLVDGSPAYPFADNASGAGSDTGLTQTGGAVDYGVNYGLRNEYIVQFDAVQVADRIDITSGAAAGTIFGPESLSVFFRGDGSGNASLFNASVDTSIQGEIPEFNTGIGGEGAWHNYAVRFDRPDQEIELFVDEVSLGVIDLTTFAGGIYQDFSNGAVSVGAGVGGGNRTWTDNFQVGGTGDRLVIVPLEIPEDPGDIAGLPAGLVAYWDFNETAGPVAEGWAKGSAFDRVGDKDGAFTGTSDRTAGLVGQGALQVNGTIGDGVNVGSEGFETSTGITVEALIAPTWDGTTLDEILRKEDGGNRILFSFQTAVHTTGFDSPGLSFGLNVGGYSELDMPLDGVDGRPTLEDLTDGEAHHVAATYDSATGEKALWIDGVKAFSADMGAGTLAVTGGAANTFIGSSNGGEPFHGIIDEVAFWDIALDADTIALHSERARNGQNYFVPEPSSFVLALLGLIGACVALRRRR